MKVENPAMLVHFPNTVVYNAIPHAAYTDLDLSPYVGVRKALCIIRILNSTGGGDTERVRTNGDASNVTSNSGVITCITNTTQIGYVVVITDDAGIIEHFGTNVAGTVVYTLEAFIHG